MVTSRYFWLLLITSRYFWFPVLVKTVNLMEFTEHKIILTEGFDILETTLELI